MNGRVNNIGCDIKKTYLGPKVDYCVRENKFLEVNYIKKHRI